MKQIDMVGLYNVTIHLNSPYFPFLNLLCFSGASMISPSSHSQTQIIDLNTDDLVGTGPFEYDYFIPNTEVRFTAFDNYWGGKANITEIVYTIITDPTTRNFAMLAGNIDFLIGHDTSLYPAFDSNPAITYVPYSDTAGLPGLTYYYLCFNNKQINVTWRKAISYAINYSVIIEYSLNGHGYRAYSCISPGYGGGFNTSLAKYNGGSAQYDLAQARQTLLDGMSGDPRLIGLTATNNTNDPAWESLTLETFNYS